MTGLLISTIFRQIAASISDMSQALLNAPQ
jgi:hypothetical protein